LIIFGGKPDNLVMDQSSLMFPIFGKYSLKKAQKKLKSCDSGSRDFRHNKASRLQL
jgi:hypothetical protein